MRAGLGVDQLGGDAQPVAGAPNAAFEQIADTEVPSDLSNVDGFALECETRRARHDGKRFEPAEGGDELVHHRKRPESLDAYELYLQAIPAMYGLRREDYRSG